VTHPGCRDWLLELQVHPLLAIVAGAVRVAEAVGLGRLGLAGSSTPQRPALQAVQLILWEAEGWLRFRLGVGVHMPIHLCVCVACCCRCASILGASTKQQGARTQLAHTEVHSTAQHSTAQHSTAQQK